MRSEHLENALAHFQNTQIKRSAPQIKHGDLCLLTQALQTIGQGGSGGFI